MSIVKSFSVGEGDMFCIKHNVDSFTTIDCCYSDDDNRNAIFNEIKNLSNSKGISRFISTHPDEDHIKGINEFYTEVDITNFYCVENEATKEDETDSFKQYCELRDSSKAYYVEKGCRRRWLNEEDEERGGAGINFLWPITSDDDYKDELVKAKEGTSYNNISPIFTYSVEDGVKIMWMGDIEHVFLEKIKEKIEWDEIDILFAPHHGRESGKVSSDVLKQLNPQIIVVGEAPSENLNYYSGYNTITQNLAGDITFDCGNDKVDVYVSNFNYNVSFLSDDEKSDTDIKHYIGSFTPKA
ncbi:hypothetical protein EQM13_10550 [Acidilutibacter cellobiosedens]|uniref:Metallo-beta-lactamase domain-containing protein n=1 Tax=Acidilutibacter cellobiosedens TaxID=2507161 RepID=A0A410QDN4_9FIRM|nr:MBL fold metallo-hydrolase [Acidilutibacter cellobiosedens]QAT61994.1 hypothetical protein EQM13_10550 [Acidilutibacter cellobiosedens]HBN04356.1 hypothetical protein [Bacteroidales bacterium]